VPDLSAVELQRVNKCITAQITDFELAILAQANDKWKPITLADGAFDLDELKKGISAADSKFSVRKYKPTALILEYLVSRAATQGVSVPAFIKDKSMSTKMKRTPDEGPKRGVKRFKSGRSRPVYSMEQDSWEEENYEENQDANWEEDEAADDDVSSSWDALAFQRKATLPPCTTPYCNEKNIAHTHSTRRCYIQAAPTERKWVTCRRATFSSFCKGQGQGQRRG
jgi:hypothetical protein